MKHLILLILICISLTCQAVTITDDGSQLKITSGTNVVLVPKKQLILNVSGDYIFIGTLKYKYTEVTNISASSASELADTIDTYLENI